MTREEMLLKVHTILMLYARGVEFVAKMDEPTKYDFLAEMAEPLAETRKYAEEVLGHASPTSRA